MGRKLSPRETEIAELVIQGLKNKEIAEILKISHKTIQTRIQRIYVKLGVFGKPNPRKQIKEIHLNTILTT